MLILAINTASSSTGIALFEVIVKSDKETKESVHGDEIRLLAEDSWLAKNDEAEKLMPAIAGLLESANKQIKSNRHTTTKITNTRSASPNSPYNFSDIKQIYVIKGPGSFTGLRVGVTVANTIAYLNSAKNFACELFGLTTFEYWHSASQAAGSDNLPVLVYAGSGGVYLSEHARSASQISEPQIINLSDLNQKLESKKIKSITGDISPAQISILKNSKFIRIRKTFAEILKPIIEKNLQKSIMREISDLKSEKIIKPLYIKEPGITQSKKQTFHK